MADLQTKAQAFAATLTTIVNGTIATGAHFEVTLLEGALAWVWPQGSLPTHQNSIPVTAGLAKGEDPKLWLRAHCQVRLDHDEKEHLAVHQSVFGLCINPETGHCAIRLEYDRDRGNEPDDPRPGRHGRAAAHVQIHGVSAELTYALAVAGHQPRPLERFHIPVGGRRFRPTLEDFIEFLHAEGLLPKLHPGWRDVIGDTRSRWLRSQTGASVRNDPKTAAEQLGRMGYQVSPPA